MSLQYESKLQIWSKLKMSKENKQTYVCTPILVRIKQVAQRETQGTPVQVQTYTYGI